jgi:cytochrome c oxidase subunit II
MLKRILFVAMIFLVFGLAFAQTHDQDLAPINVTAKRFEFTPSEITVHKGQTVTLAITSADVTHGLIIKDLNVLAEFKKGSPTNVTFQPKQVGDFVGECAHFCGVGHGKMHFVVHVRE